MRLGKPLCSRRLWGYGNGFHLGFLYPAYRQIFYSSWFEFWSSRNYASTKIASAYTKYIRTHLYARVACAINNAIVYANRVLEKGNPSYSTIWSKRTAGFEVKLKRSGNLDATDAWSNRPCGNLISRTFTFSSTTSLRILVLCNLIQIYIKCLRSIRKTISIKKTIIRNTMRAERARGYWEQ